MANRDRRAQRKVKKRQQRIRQNKHQTKFGLSDFVSDEPRRLPKRLINVLHVPGGYGVEMERTFRILNFLVGGRKMDDPKEVREILITKLDGDAWHENHSRMLLSSAIERGQKLALDALEEEEPSRAITLAKEALVLDPACCDAHMIIATREIADAGARLPILQTALANERERLGSESFFTENHGDFWWVNESRPYMRALFAYAMAFKAHGQYAEASAQCRILLDLDINDHLAARHQRLACLMAGDLLEELETALPEHNDRREAPWLWAKVLERWLAGDTEGAKQIMIEARDANSLVPAVLCIESTMRPPCPPHYQAGEVTEAVYIADVYGCAWDQHPAALAWLLENV